MDGVGVGVGGGRQKLGRKLSVGHRDSGGIGVLFGLLWFLCAMPLSSPVSVPFGVLCFWGVFLRGWVLVLARPEYLPCPLGAFVAGKWWVSSLAFACPWVRLPRLLVL